MEREILFRGKRVDNGEFSIGLLMASFDGNYCIQERHDFDGMEYFSTHKVDYKTVGQFTGLCDKNGVKIFEGDLFKIGSEDYVLEVKFEHGCFLAYKDGSQYGLVGELKMCFIKVIGNIHDND